MLKFGRSSRRSFTSYRRNGWAMITWSFGKYKIEYIIHVGHLMALALFFLEIAKTGIEVARDIMRVILGVFADIRLAVQRNTK